MGVGPPGSFNDRWSVLPLLHRVGPLWHLYFSGQSSRQCPFSKTNQTGLQMFWGIGVATSTDGVVFTPRPTPVIYGNETAEYPENWGVAGGGSIIEDVDFNGRVSYRQYYTLAVGHTSPDIKVDQKKVCAVAHSVDGLAWHNHSVVMGPLSTSVNNREDVACAAPVVWRDASGMSVLLRLLCFARFLWMFAVFNFLKKLVF